MLLRLEETCSKVKVNHAARLPRSTLTSDSLPISSVLMHKTPLQCSTGQKLLTYSFAIWLGVFQHSWTLYLTLVTANTGQYSTNFDSDWIHQCNRIYLNCSDEYFHKRSDRCLYKAVNYVQEVGQGVKRITSKNFTPTVQFQYKLSRAQLRNLHFQSR